MNIACIFSLITNYLLHTRPIHAREMHYILEVSQKHHLDKTIVKFINATLQNANIQFGSHHLEFLISGFDIDPF